MSVRVQSWVWRESKASGHALVVLLKIADNADDDGCNAWPSVSYLAKMCRCSESTVKRAVAELKDMGEIEVQIQQGNPVADRNPRYAPNTYRIVMAGHEGGQNDTPWTSGGSKTAVRGVKTDGSGGSPVTYKTSLEPSRTNGVVVEFERTARAAAAMRETNALVRTNPCSKCDGTGMVEVPTSVLCDCEAGQRNGHPHGTCEGTGELTSFPMGLCPACKGSKIECTERQGDGASSPVGAERADG